MLPSDPRTRAYLALAAICIIWGTTYTAIKFAVRDFPPYLLVGIRQTAAGLLLLALAFAAGRVRLQGYNLQYDRILDAHEPNEAVQTKVLDRTYILRQALIGLATITGGNGFITWGMQYVSSGLSAVIGSLTPVVVVFINLLWRGTEQVNKYVLSGVLLGFGGLGIIFSEGWADFANPVYRWGIAGCFASCLSWSLGTVLAKRFNRTDVSPMLNAGLQITAGGLGGFLMSGLFDTSYTIHHTPEGWGAVFYLTLIGSAVAFTLYMYVLKHLSATVSSLYTYINPVVAILLGWLLLGEHLNWLQGVGIVVTIAGVWLINRGQR